jgi:hypothetical protein
MTPEELHSWFKAVASVGWIPVVTTVFVFFVNKHFFSSYLTEKGKNAATKEDIAKITHEVEGVRTQYASLVEELKARHQLRLAAIDRRLEVHQEAFTLWRELMSVMHSKDVDEVAKKCGDWWGKNCVYLEEGVRESFVLAYRSALDHAMLLEQARRTRNKQNVDLVTANWSRITDFPNLLFKAVQLPGLTELEANELRAGEDTLKLAIEAPKN